jgi:hypothetical protein
MEVSWTWKEYIAQDIGEFFVIGFSDPLFSLMHELKSSDKTEISVCNPSRFIIWWCTAAVVAGTDVYHGAGVPGAHGDDQKSHVQHVHQQDERLSISFFFLRRRRELYYSIIGLQSEATKSDKKRGEQSDQTRLICPTLA